MDKVYTDKIIFENEEETVFETKTNVDFNDRDTVAQLIIEYDLLVHKLLYQIAQLKRELAKYNVKTY